MGILLAFTVGDNLKTTFRTNKSLTCYGLYVKLKHVNFAALSTKQRLGPLSRYIHKVLVGPRLPTITTTFDTHSEDTLYRWAKQLFPDTFDGHFLPKTRCETG